MTLSYYYYKKKIKIKKKTAAVTSLEFIIQFFALSMHRDARARERLVPASHRVMRPGFVVTKQSHTTYSNGIGKVR